MLNVLAGRIPADLEVRKTQKGKDVCSTSVYVWPGKDQEAVVVKVEAWGDMAHKLAEYKKGDTIQFIGEAKNMKHKPKGFDKEIPVMGYVIRQIDDSKTILKEVNELLGCSIKSDRAKNKALELEGKSMNSSEKVKADDIKKEESKVMKQTTPKEPKKGKEIPLEMSM